MRAGIAMLNFQHTRGPTLFTPASAGLQSQCQYWDVCCDNTGCCETSVRHFEAGREV